jgi:hypothetical protein
MTDTNDDAAMVMESKPEAAPHEHEEEKNNGGDAVMSETGEGEEAKSALRANIDNKGKNAYYFAHANTVCMLCFTLVPKKLTTWSFLMTKLSFLLASQKEFDLFYLSLLCVATEN